MSTLNSNTAGRWYGFMSSHMVIFFEPDTMVWRTFEGLSQLTVKCAAALVFIGIVRYPTHDWPAPIGSAPRAATSIGKQSSGENRIHDRYLVTAAQLTKVFDVYWAGCRGRCA